MTFSFALGASLDELASLLDISPAKYRQAVERYEAVGGWLDGPGSSLQRFRPRVFTQGSFRLGTVVRPAARGKDADYDIDLVCRLDVPKHQIAPAELKRMVGDRLKEHATYRRLLSAEGRRCWTLSYAELDGIGFHLDVLPAVPEAPWETSQLAASGVQASWAALALGITHRSAPDDYHWLLGGTNPEAYANWFEERNSSVRELTHLSEKRKLFEANRSFYEKVEDVPDALVRTPLQRAIQLLKRHRDVRFGGHLWEDDKPISIILTTLATRIYRGESDVGSSLETILEGLENAEDSHLISRVGEKWTIPNPVNPKENFADRWAEPGCHRAEAFFEWISWFREDLALAEEDPGSTRAREILAESFGAPAGSLRSSQTGRHASLSSEAVPPIGMASHCRLPPWPIALTQKVRVNGSVRRKLNSTKSLWLVSSRPIPKNFAIRFKAETSTPPPYEVRWQVVNTGAEAAAAGQHQLRGGFDTGAGVMGDVRWETTAYRGTHWIEAFVVKDGTCVARSGKVFVRVS